MERSLPLASLPTRECGSTLLIRIRLIIKLCGRKRGEKWIIVDILDV